MTDFLLSDLVAYSSYYLHKTQAGESMAPDVTPIWLAPLPCNMQQAVIQVITQSICSGVLPLLLPTHLMMNFIFFCTQEKERTMISGIKPRTTEPLARLALTEWSRVDGTMTLTFSTCSLAQNMRFKYYFWGNAPQRHELELKECFRSRFVIGALYTLWFGPCCRSPVWISLVLLLIRPRIDIRLHGKSSPSGKYTTSERSSQPLRHRPREVNRHFNAAIG